MGTGQPLSKDQSAETLLELYPVARLVRWLVVDPAMSVDAFETAFQYTFGLSAQVLRRSGYTWDDLENTRHWSLQDQNQKGRQMTRSLGANV